MGPSLVEGGTEDELGLGVSVMSEVSAPPRGLSSCVCVQQQGAEPANASAKNQGTPPPRVPPPKHPPQKHPIFDLGAYVS